MGLYPFSSNCRDRLPAIELAFAITNAVVSGDRYADSVDNEIACCFAFCKIRGIDSLLKYTASTDNTNAPWNDLTKSWT